MSLEDQTIALFIFFPVLCTISLGLRLFVRTRLRKGAFGWDDIALVVTWVGLILWVAMASESIAAGYGTDRFVRYYDAKNYVCYVISGVVKISVALVLYKLDTRLFIRGILIADMITCAIWTVVVTLILGLGCTESSPYVLSVSVCQGADYAQEASYVFFNVLHVLIPIIILWGIQINGNLKWAVITLFSVGLLAAVAAVMKLEVYIEYYHPTASTDYLVLWHQSMIWAVTEHGLSLFAASILAIRPFFTYLSTSYTSLSTKVTSRRSMSDAQGSSIRVSKSSNWPGTRTGSVELGKIGVRSEVDVRSVYNAEQRQSLATPAYLAEAFGQGESARGLGLSGSRAHLRAEAGEAV